MPAPGRGAWERQVNVKGSGRTMWSDLPETQELLDRARRGEASAVERLLSAHREPLRRVIGMRLDPALAARVDASDVVQDVLLEAHRRLHDYLRNPAMPCRLWLRIIAKDNDIAAPLRLRPPPTEIMVS